MNIVSNLGVRKHLKIGSSGNSRLLLLPWQCTEKGRV